MIQNKKVSKFWRLTLGLLFFGIGQRLFYTGAVSPWARDRGLPILLLVLSFVALVVGLLLILPVVVWFYKRHRSDKRLPKLILAYLLSAVVAGLVIGGIGQLLYKQTSLSYHQVRVGIWMFSTIFQNIFKIVLVFGLVSISKSLPIRSRLSYLRLPLSGFAVLTTCLLLCSYWFPVMGSLLLFVLDAVLLMSLYYFVYLMKENAYEKAP